MADGAKVESVGAGGIVDVGGTLFHVRPLSHYGEAALFEALREMAKKAMGPGSFVAEALPVIDYLKSVKRFDEAAALQRDANTLVLTKGSVSDEAVFAFRRTPDGVAKELHARTRDGHPKVAEKEIRAVINEVNAPDVFHKMREAVSGPKDETPSDPPAG